MSALAKPITHPLFFAAYTLTDASTILVDASKGNYFTVTLAASGHTLGNPSNAIDGMTFVLDVIQGGSGSNTLSYGSQYKFGTTYASPTLTTTLGATDKLTFVYNAAATKWRCTDIALGF